MATFEAQVEGLTGLSIDGSSAPTQDELSEFLKDGVMDVTNKCIQLNPQDKILFTAESAEQTSNNSFTVKGEILSVVRESGTDNDWRSCRYISPSMQGRVVDTDSLNFASKFNPVYTILDNGKINVFPTPDNNPDSFKVYYINNDPKRDSDAAVLAYNSEDIRFFPKDKVYLVVIYAGIKSLQNAMGSLHGNSDITTALTAINTELDETQAVCDLINTQIDSAIVEIAKAVTEAGEMITQTDNSGDFETALDAINTAVDKFRADADDPALFGDENQYLTGVGMTHVKDALELARDAIDTGFTTDEDSGSGDDSTPKSVGYWLTDEDPEMVQVTLQTAQAEIQRAQAHIAEWNATVQALQAEISGFATEVNSRAAFTGAKGQAVQSIIAEANAYINAAQGYSSEIQSKIGIANGYSQEVQIRMSNLAQEYQWYDKRYMQLKQEYDQAFAMMAPRQQGGQ